MRLNEAEQLSLGEESKKGSLGEDLLSSEPSQLRVFTKAQSGKSQQDRKSVAPRHSQLTTWQKRRTQEKSDRN